MRFFLLLVVLVVISCKPDGASNANTTKANDQKEIQNSKENNQKAASQSKDRNQTAKEQVSTLKTNDSKGGTQAKSQTNFNKEGIPDACDLLSAKTVAKYVRQPEGSIFLADGSSPQNPKARACFFKWDGSELANAGVMVQLQRNPVQEEVPEYFTYLISSKKTEGEKDPASKSVIKYNDWPGFGDDGAYSTEAGKYVWRVGNDWSFMVAFNTVLEPKAQKVAADAFAREVMSKMSF